MFRSSHVDHVDHINEEVLNSFDGQIKINVEPILHTPSAKTYFPLEFQARSSIFLFIS
jgi:hypothetical protein